MLNRRLQDKLMSVGLSSGVFEIAVENAFDHIVLTDADGVVIYANKAATIKTGYPLEEMIGSNPSLWGGQMDRLFYKKFWTTIKKRKRPFVGELINRRKNGTKYFARVSVTPILDDAGEVMMFLGIERDITKQKIAEQMKMDFISFASHELRNPLTVIGLNAEFLIAHNKGLNLNQTRAVHNIYRYDRQMVELVNALLDVNKIELGEWSVDKQKIDVLDLIDSSLHNEEVMIREKKIKVKKDFAKNIKMVSDPKMLKLLFDNLISNAVKYSRSGGEVKIKVKEEDKQLHCTITDQGYGIPKAQQKLIFSRLFRADNARKERIEGNGLGLYLCKMVVGRLGGKISFKSQLNKGTTFLVTLPLK